MVPDLKTMQPQQTSTPARAGGRSALWLPLLATLTEKFPRWSVWKNVRSALEGHGDVDSFAPREDWHAIEVEFNRWAAENGLSPVIVCRHIPQGPHFIAIDPTSDYIVQLDVKDRATLRGCTLLDVDQLQQLSEIDERGFRRIRPGGEGVIKLLTNGMTSGGHMNEEGIATKGVVDLLRNDREGVLAIAAMFGRAREALIRGVDALLLGEWDQRAMRAVELHAYRRALTEPGVALSRIWFNQVSKKRCPVIRLIREDDRRLPDDRQAWIADVSRTHSITYHADHGKTKPGRSNGTP